jgi:hypothetical protein
MRNATDADIPEILRLGEALHRLRRFPLPTDRGRTAAAVASLIRSPDGLCLVADGGFLVAQRAQTATSRETVGMMHAWLGPEALLDAYEEWSPLAQVCSRPGDASMARRLERRGYQPAELNWFRRG